MKKLLVLGLLVIGFNTQAGVLIEPYAGLDYGLSADTKLTYQNNPYTYNSDSESGLSYGGRLGYSFLGLFVAADYSRSSFEIEDLVATSGGGTVTTGSKEKSDINQSAMGITIGYKFPALFRIWGKYLFNVNWKIDEDRWLQSLPLGTASFVTELSGSGYALGFGYMILPAINIFAEYQVIELDEIEEITYGGADQKSDFSNYERKRSSILIGVGFPFDF